jgi:arylsulfatase A-like enzyme
MVHSIIDASPEFTGKSKGGLYGDTVEELDHHCGRLIDAIDDLGLRDDTIVVFTSDNGPWSNMQQRLRERHGGRVAWGAPGPLRGAKGSTYEGGLRVPCVVRWPGHVPAGRTSGALFSTLDFLPTFGRLAGYAPPADRLIDGVDQTDLLTGRSEVGARHDYFYFARGELHGVRRGRWKLMLADRKSHYSYVKDRGTDGVELYDLATDVGEQRDVSEEHPELVEDLLAYARAFPMPAERYDPRIGLPKRK